MSMKIVWSPAALQDFEQNINYLQIKWNDDVVKRFVTATADCLNRLASYPAMYPISKYKNVRTAILVKQVSLLYTIEEDTIFLLRFWNNLQNPENEIILEKR